MNSNAKQIPHSASGAQELEQQQLTSLYAVPVVSRHENWRAEPGAQEHIWVLQRPENTR